MPQALRCKETDKAQYRIRLVIFLRLRLKAWIARWAERPFGEPDLWREQELVKRYRERKTPAPKRDRRLRLEDRQG